MNQSVINRIVETFQNRETEALEGPDYTPNYIWGELGKGWEIEAESYGSDASESISDAYIADALPVILEEGYEEFVAMQAQTSDFSGQELAEIRKQAFDQLFEGLDENELEVTDAKDYFDSYMALDFHQCKAFQIFVYTFGHEALAIFNDEFSNYIWENRQVKI